MKLSPEKLKKALPLSYENNTEKSYLTAAFATVEIIWGNQVFQRVEAAIQKMDMVSVLDNDYDYVKNLYT